MGFWVCFGCFWRFRLLSVRPSGQWMGYVLCRELVLGVWGLEPETNLNWINIYWSCAPPIFWTSVSTVGLSERGLNLGYLTCSLMAMCYVLCRELVLGVWGLEPETNFEMNEYILKLCTSCFLDVRLDRRSVWERSELRQFNTVALWQCAMFCAENLS